MRLWGALNGRCLVHDDFSWSFMGNLLSFTFRDLDDQLRVGHLIQSKRYGLRSTPERLHNIRVLRGIVNLNNTLIIRNPRLVQILHINGPIHDALATLQDKTGLILSADHSAHIVVVVNTWCPVDRLLLARTVRLFNGRLVS